jgi:starch synthase
MAPFVKTGGLGEVIGSLPKKLRDKDLDVRVVVPFYKNRDIAQKDLEFLTEFVVFDDWRKHSAKIFCNNLYLPVYFVDNDYYFNRTGIYGYGDDFERFAFFSYASLKFLEEIGFQPSIINLNDWQTALCCLYLKKYFMQKEFYRNIKSVFTIHNLQYQGIFGREIMNRILLDDNDFINLEYYSNINFMKAGLIYADRVTTVSQTYACEIQTKTYGYGLDGVLRQKQNIIGITNGIDYDKYNPEKDKEIVNFSFDNLENKKINKKNLCEEFNLEFNERIPVVAMVSRFAEQKGFDLIYKSLENILSLNLKLIILGMGDVEIENLFLNAQKRFVNNFRVDIGFDDFLAKKIYASADIFLMPSRFEPCGLSQIISMRYGTIPVARRTGGLVDTISDFTDKNINEITQNDIANTNGFLFNNYDTNSLLEILNKAIYFYSRMDDWKVIIKNAMSRDYSWTSSAQKYIDLYNSI